MLLAVLTNVLMSSISESSKKERTPARGSNEQVPVATMISGTSSRAIYFRGRDRYTVYHRFNLYALFLIYALVPIVKDVFIVMRSAAPTSFS